MATYSLTWDAASVGGALSVDDHDIGYTPSGGEEVVVQTGSASGQHVVSGLGDGVSYSFRVRAKVGNLAGPWSPALVVASLWSVELMDKLYHWSN